MVNSSNDVRLSCMEIALRRRRDQTRVVARLSGSLFIVIKQLDEWEGRVARRPLFPLVVERLVGSLAADWLVQQSAAPACLPRLVVTLTEDII